MGEGGILGCGICGLGDCRRILVGVSEEYLESWLRVVGYS